MLLKWLFDRIVSLIGLLVLWPVLVVVAILVKVKMPGGPAFFVQNRVGKGGKLFKCHKFRTMTVKHNGSSYADKLEGDDRDVLRLRPGITGPATLKYRLEDEMISEYVAKKQKEGDTREMQEIAVEYNDTVIYPDKVRLNCYYYRNYSFIKDIQMIFCTVLGKNMKYAGEVI